MEQLEQTQTLPMQNVWATQQISPKIILTVITIVAISQNALS